jgi:hypothetical protein
MKHIIAVIGLAVFSVAGHACPESYVGKMPGHKVVMGDIGCTFSEDMIYTLRITHTNAGDEPIAPVSFDSQCKSSKDGFSCKPSGQTVLAGTKYKAVRGLNSCGVVVWPNFKCAEGCEKPGVPAYLQSTPSDCD